MRGGAGDDTFDLHNVLVDGEARLDLGRGAGTLITDEGSRFRAGLEVEGRGDADHVDIHGGLDVARDARFELRGGADVVAIQDARFAGDLFIRTGTGDDTVSLLDPTAVAGKTVIDTGTGTDVVVP